MHELLKKLNHKGQDIYCLNAPPSFLNDLAQSGATVHNRIDAANEIEFVLVFVTLQKEIDNLVPELVPKLKGDALLWMCYPKSSSKRHKCDFNRDTGWAIMGRYNLEGVRMVAIDDDWSALRFRNVAYIKTMTRSKLAALSAEGKRKTAYTKKNT
jgi:hypothetical protein